MRSLLLLLALLIAGPAMAQETPVFPDYTPEQRWQRASALGMVAMAAAVRHAKDTGQSVEQFGDWWVDLFDDSWGEPGSYGPAEVLRGMRRNWLSFYGGQVEVVEASDDVATGRFNRAPMTAVFGDDRLLYGISLEEFEQINSMFYRGIAEYHGLVAEERREGDDVVVTFRRPPEP
jgi:hypothetical protein